MTAATLKIEIRSDWHPGTGRGSGFHLDAVTHEGPDGLPRLPGRTLKGLLRDALYRAEAWGWPDVPSGSTRVLFGAHAEQDGETSAGLLRVADATLPAEVAAYLTTDQGKRLVPGLYRERFSTAIGPDGVAAGRSLRGMRVVVPLTLFAPIAEVPGVTAIAGWRKRLAAVLPLIDAVGAHRTRGLGRAVLSFEED